MHEILSSPALILPVWRSRRFPRRRIETLTQALAEGSTISTEPEHEYTVRVSPRAKRVTLSMSLAGGLVVVVPKGYDTRRIPMLLALEANRRWIERAAARLASSGPVPLPGIDTSCPDAILLPSIEEAWTIEYEKTAGSSLRLRQTGPRTLLLTGRIDSEPARRAILLKWLRSKAGEHLVPWLEGLSRDFGLPFARVTIRAQQSRWASCSLRKSINLNCKLLFLPPELVRYVLIHELCHTIHPNHSADFWGFVGRFEPGFRERRAALRGATRYVPEWLAGK